MSTNKEVLYKGIKILGYALPLMFIGPSIIHMSFKNQKHWLYIPVLGLGILLCILSIFLIFRGLKTIMKSLFDGK